MALAAEAILDRVRRIPAGFVASYGDVSPGAPRQAGKALSQAPADVPWWRVVHADGTWVGGARQRALLLEDDVPIRGKRVVMDEARIPPDALV